MLSILLAAFIFISRSVAICLVRFFGFVEQRMIGMPLLGVLPMVPTKRCGCQEACLLSPLALPFSTTGMGAFWTFIFAGFCTIFMVFAAILAGFLLIGAFFAL